jgi:hypothetical protein
MFSPKRPSAFLALNIAVFDIARKTGVLKGKVDPLPRNDYDFALSPDGTKLAVLNDRVLSVYSIPAP